jgi:O-antigen/teichoic acid export membrane protein
MTVTRDVGRNTLIQVAGKLVGILCSLVLVILFNRYLGIEDFGRYNIAMTYMLFFFMLADLGFLPITIRELSQARDRKEQSRKFGSILSLRIGVALIVYATAGMLIYLFPYDSVTIRTTQIVLASAFMNTVIGLFLAVYQVNYRTVWPVIGEMITRVLSTALILYGFVYQHIDLVIAVLIVLLATAVGSSFTYINSRRFLKFSLHWDSRYIREFFWAAVVLGIGLVLGMLHYKIDTILLSIFKDPEQVGLYGISYKVFEIFVMIPGLFSALMLPVMSRYAKANPGELKRIVQKAVDMVLVPALSTSVVIIVLAPFLVYVVSAGNPSDSSTLALRILVISVPVLFLSSQFGYLIIATGRQKELIRLNLIAIAVNVSLNLYVIPRYSFLGAAVVTVTSELLVAVLLWRTVIRIADLRVNLRILKRAIPVLLILGVTGLVFSQFNEAVLDIVMNRPGLPVQILLIAVLSGLWFLFGLLLILSFRIVDRRVLLEIINLKNES